MTISVEQVRERFEEAWRSGERPRIDFYLRELSADEQELGTRQLVCIDIQARVLLGEQPSVEDYASLLPQARDWLEHALVWLVERGPPTATEVADPDASLTTRSVKTEQYPPSTIDSERAFALAAPRLAAAAPQRIGRYQVLGVLGAGGFGVAYRAFDPDLQRPVAIKVPHRHRLPGAGELDEFLREARVAARLSHPGIVPVFDCGVTDEGRGYIVMELMQGGSLADELERGPMPLLRAIDCGIALAEAVHYAHQHGLFHRDLKPRNILMADRGQPKVADFGLALEAATPYAYEGDVSGTPAYMAPEQVRGESHLLDGRADVWALGVILYEMLTGQRPFRAPTRAGVFHEIEAHDPRPPRQIDDRIPRDIERCVLRCLAKSPRDRYPTAADLADDLRRWQTSASLGSAGQDSLRPDAPAPTAAAASERSHPNAMRKFPARALRWAGGLGFVALVLSGAMVLRGYLPDNGPATTSPGGDPARLADLPGPGDPPPRDARVALLPAGDPVARPLEDLLPAGPWHPLLAGAPAVRRWPLIERNSILDYRAPERELWLTCDNLAVLELGRTFAKSFELRMELLQTPWTGGAGIVWGMHDLPENPRSLGALALRLQPNRLDSVREYLALEYSTLAFDERGGINPETTIRSATLSKPASQGVFLHLTVTDGSLTRVQWGNRELTALTVPNPYVDLPAHRHQGGFGVIGLNSHTVFRNAAIRFPP